MTITQDGSKARIAQFIETDIPGGAEQVLLDLCTYARETASDIELIVISFPHDWFREQCKVLGIPYLEIPFQLEFKSTKTLPIFCYKLSKWLKANNISLVHSHLFGPITGAALACKLTGIPHIGTLHDIYMIEEKPSRFLFIQLAAVLGTKLITVSRNMEEFYKSRGWFPKNAIETIYNGVKIVKNTRNLRKELGLSPDALVLACVGRLIPLKQVDKVVQAFQEVNSNLNVQLLIVGEGPEKDRIKSEISGENVHLLGVRSDVTDILQSIDIFVQYSTTEGLSRSIIEACAVGLPCIVSDVGGNKEIIKNNRNGVLVDAHSRQTLSKAMRTLFENPDLRAQYSRYSKTHAAKHFSFEANNKKYLDLYRQKLTLCL